MLKKLLKDLADTLGQKQKEFVVKFDDPIAQQTKWAPLKAGGASFCTRRLRVSQPSYIEFKPTKSSIFFYSIFLVVGLCILVILPIAFPNEFNNPEILLPILVGGVFAVVGGVLLYYGTLPIAFDRQRGLYINGARAKKDPMLNSSNEGDIRLSEIYALQILRERVRGNKRSFYSYELNLVLRDAKRINVIDHGSYPKMLEDATKLSELLEKPIWDAVEKP